jgi:hypothetical protein
MAKSPEELAHIEWLGYVQPIGLVVSIPAMLEAQCYVNKNIMAEHARFLNCLARDSAGNVQTEIRDLREFVQSVLGWESDDLVTLPAKGPLPPELSNLEVVLPQYHETLRPTHVVPEFSSNTNPQSPPPNPYLLLIQELASKIDLDEPLESDSAKHWNASPQAKFERLLRETGVPIGLLFNRSQFRLVYAPRGETSGYATFNVDEMAQVAGRPMFAALHMLLGVERLFSLADKQRLPYILENSRKYQNTVSTALAEQVTSALFELLRGFQAANDQRVGELLRHVLANNPQHVYHGLLTVLMRLVFVLYAEDRGLVSSDPTYTNHYSVSGLFERLRSEAGRFPDTMDQRFGAWAQLLTLFRLVYEGGQHAELKIPARKGYLFDPNRYPFLEGRGDSGLGDGDLGLGAREWGLGDRDDSSVVSGSESLAVGDGPDSASLSSDQIVSERRAVRPDQSNSAGSEFNSSKHRGGAREGQQGIPAVSENLAGKSHGTGNAPPVGSESRDTPARTSERTATNDRTTRSNAQQASAGTQKPIPSPKPQIPRISDGVIYRVLEDLLILDGERLSYRTLDVEQIGSVYEAIMGFELQVSAGKSIAIKPVKSHGAPATINLEALLAAKSADRAKLLNEWTDQKLGAGDAAAIKDATSIDDLVAALDKKIAKHVTPGIVPADSMVFQPSDERRRSGSHYTPRSLTQPIVRTTLEPILKQMYDPEAPLPKVYEPTREDKQRYTAGELEARVRLSKKHIAATESARAVGCAHPWQILELKVCDPAMGSGAFLVETCRQLGDELIKAWYAHDMIPADIPPDEDEVLYARRTVAQRCLYGVDKNIMAVDLAKLSLWLVTLAKDHPFTFLDHALRHGDSLVGLTREQIIGFHWEPKKQKKFGEDLIQKRLDRATEARAKILSAREDVAYRDQEQRMAVANEALNLIRLVGDACVSCFFSADKSKAREEELERVFSHASSYLSSLTTNNQQLTTTPDFQSRAALQSAADRLRVRVQPIPAIHWEIEFPEVFSRENGGFDAFVGNPPFMKGGSISGVFGPEYLEWLKTLHSESHGNADFVTHFFRKAWDLIASRRSIGLIATNTICQGDTKNSGLLWICNHGGTIYSAKKRLPWVGHAAVTVSVVHLYKGTLGFATLDGKKVDRISAYLFHQGGDRDPYRLQTNTSLSFTGPKIYGIGFTFDDQAGDAATPVSTIKELINKNAANAERIFPLLGGQELNNSPTHQNSRFVIDFGEMSYDEAAKWPDLISILANKVKPERQKVKRSHCKDNWWRFEHSREDLNRKKKSLMRVLVHAFTAPHLAFAFVSPEVTVAAPHVVLAIEHFSAFAVLQSRVHETWVRFFASTLEDRLRYTSSDCFDTFPFPKAPNETHEFEAVGASYYTYRANLMVSINEGLTQTYNRFHSPDEHDTRILELRRLHGEMDVAALRAYGWNDLADQAAQSDFCQFLLDYEEENDTGSDSSITSHKKKPWRYRWPDDFRDEVLARLLELNEQRHKEELLLVKGMSTEAKPAKEPSKKPAKATPLLDGLDQVELDRDERIILLIVDSFKLITRPAVDEAFIAMKYPKLRKSRLGLGEPPKSVPHTDAGRDALIGGLVDRGFLEKHPSDHQQVWKLGASAPSLAATVAERKAFEETKAIFQKSIDANDDLASCKEGVTDAKPGLVSIA